MNAEMLRKVLCFDVVGSAVSVAVTIVGASLLAGWLDVSIWVPIAVGVILIPWVLFLARAVRRTPVRPTEVWVVIAGNLGWGLAAAVLIIGFPDALSVAGRWIVGVFSLAVVDLGIVEWFGLRGGRHSTLTGAAGSH